MMNLFSLDTTPTMPGKFIIRVNSQELGCTLLETGGSWGVLPSRVLGISYPDWLRLCRDEFGAQLIGKNCLYICPYFESNENTRGLVRLLNKMASIMDTDYNIDQLMKQMTPQQKEGVEALLRD